MPLPPEIENLILSYNIHPCAELIKNGLKKKWKSTFYSQVLYAIGGYGESYRTIYLGSDVVQSRKRVPMPFLRFLHYRLCNESSAESGIRFIQHMLSNTFWDVNEQAKFLIENGKKDYYLVGKI